MTTFSSQRRDPGVAKAEERLCDILTCLGLNVIILVYNKVIVYLKVKTEYLNWR